MDRLKIREFAAGRLLYKKKREFWDGEWLRSINLPKLFYQMEFIEKQIFTFLLNSVVFQLKSEYWSCWGLLFVWYASVFSTQVKLKSSFPSLSLHPAALFGLNMILCSIKESSFSLHHFFLLKITLKMKKKKSYFLEPQGRYTRINPLLFFFRFSLSFCFFLFWEWG
jgi:hypothetical protein